MHAFLFYAFILCFMPLEAFVPLEAFIRISQI